MHKYIVNWFSTKEPRKFNKEKSLSTNGAGITGESQGGKITPYPHLTPYKERDYLRQKIDLNVKTKTMELQEENIGKYLCDLGTEKVSQHTKSSHHRRKDKRYTGHYQD